MNKLFNNDIKLNRDSHIYELLDDSDIDFKSVTTFIGDFFEEFDAEKIATKLVQSNIKYMHLTVEELLEQWTQAADYGTLVHEELENFILYKKPVNEQKSKQGIQWLQNYIIKSDFKIYSEAIVYSKELKLAGTIDLLMYDKNTDTYIIIDWKTSRKIETSSYGHKTGNHDITRNLEDCNYNHYSLQLSLYRYILENYYNINISNQMIVHITDRDCRGYVTPYLINHIKLMANSQINTKD